MDHDFWHRNWERNEIGFHTPVPNPLLVTHFTALKLPTASRVFLPLCGKSLDIHWLLAGGYRVAGAELSRVAVEQLFAALSIAPDITPVAQMIRYSAAGLDIFVGDIFDLTRDALGPVDAIYDRAALIALPAPARERYADLLMRITDGAPQLLVTLDYDQSLVDGPPFAVPPTEVARHYGHHYQIGQRAAAPEPGGVKGKAPGTEAVWLLTRRA